jgi:hypothetical protein
LQAPLTHFFLRHRNTLFLISPICLEDLLDRLVCRGGRFNRLTDQT